MEVSPSHLPAPRGQSYLFPDVARDAAAAEARRGRRGAPRDAEAAALAPDPSDEGDAPLPALASSDWSGLEDLRPDVRAALARHSCRASELDDVVQESLIRAARYRGSLTDTERLRGWVIRIALNVMRDHMRRDLRIPRVEEAEEVFASVEGREGIPGEDPDDEPVEAEGLVFEREYVMRHLDMALAELPRMDQRVLGAWYADADDVRASQVRESMSELAKVRAFRARSRLTRLMRSRLALDVADAEEAESAGDQEGRRGARCAAGTDRKEKPRGSMRRARS